MIFDTHSHLQFDDYADIELEIDKMTEFGVKYATLIGSDYELSKKGLELAKKYPCFFAAVGIHPDDVGEYADIYEEVEKIEKLIIENREDIVAIGEIGFDYFRLEKLKEQFLKERQKELFLKQVEISLKYNLPVIIHTRNAAEDTLKFIKESGLKKFVVHCFTENYDFAKDIMDYSPNAFFGFSGIVTFKNAKDIQNAASKIPLDRILIETDAPFLTPEPFRGKMINTSGYTKFVLDKIKELRTEAAQIVEAQIFDNSLKFYNIKS